jgi:hypothetical protein
LKLYLYKRVIGVTGSFHDEGGLVIITGDDPAVRWDIHATKVNEFSGTELNTVALYTREPDLVLDVPPDTEPAVYVFPDAGCC